MGTRMRFLTVLRWTCSFEGTPEELVLPPWEWCLVASWLLQSHELLAYMQTATLERLLWLALMAWGNVLVHYRIKTDIHLDYVDHYSYGCLDLQRYRFNDAKSSWTLLQNVWGYHLPKLFLCSFVIAWERYGSFVVKVILIYDIKRFLCKHYWLKDHTFWCSISEEENSFTDMQYWHITSLIRIFFMYNFISSGRYACSILCFLFVERVSCGNLLTWAIQLPLLSIDISVIVSYLNRNWRWALFFACHTIFVQRRKVFHVINNFIENPI